MGMNGYEWIWRDEQGQGNVARIIRRVKYMHGNRNMSDEK